MDTLHLVDPELRPLLQVFPTVLLSEEALPAMRAAERLNALPIPLDPAVRDAIEKTVRTVPGPAGAPDISLHIYTPRAKSAARLPCIYHIHGGGFVGGSAAAMEPLHLPLAHELGCVIVSVDYRLAPETRFPGAIEDCYAGLAWLNAHVDELNVDPARIGVMGESAGGGLAAALALMVRDRGEHRLAFQHLVYPMLDDRTCVTKTPNPVAGEFIWPPHNNLFGWTALLGHAPGAPDVSPYAAPARATDLSGLPPTFIGVPTLDLFVDEDLDYAARLARAGVAVELHLYPGGVHGFDIAPICELSRRANADARAFLKRALLSQPVR